MKKRTAKKPKLVLTIGHSTRDLETFIGLLHGHDVTCVIDVRTVPRSRHNPQFNKESLPGALHAAGIAYEHILGLGGLRHTHADSPNKGWRNASFRGYADYMQTDRFEESLEMLIARAIKDRVVLMCAETVPWRCHRSLIADALSVRGIPVEHILSTARTQMHKLTPWVRIRGKQITYLEQDCASREESAVNHRMTGIAAAGTREDAR
ncbi:MAG: DUF488 domain-containing protein [Thermoguttaceae bacterium]